MQAISNEMHSTGPVTITLLLTTGERNEAMSSKFTRRRIRRRRKQELRGYYRAPLHLGGGSVRNGLSRAGEARTVHVSASSYFFEGLAEF